MSAFTNLQRSSLNSCCSNKLGSASSWDPHHIMNPSPGTLPFVPVYTVRRCSTTCWRRVATSLEVIILKLEMNYSIKLASCGLG